MKRNFMITLLALMIFTAGGCSNNENPMDYISSADIFTGRSAEAGMWYVCTAKIVNLDDKLCEIEPQLDEKSKISVSFAEEDLNEIKIGDSAVILGKLVTDENNKKFVNAKILDITTVMDNFVIAKLSEKGTYSNIKYSNYQYDKNIEEIIAYEMSGDERGTVSLKYDSQGNLIEKSIKGNYGTETHTYTYTDDNLLFTDTETYDYDHIRNGNVFEHNYEKSADGKITKETVVNVADPERYTTYTYDEYDGNNVIKKTEYGEKKSYKITYEYDEYGNVIKESTLGMSQTYEYGIVANKNK